MSVFDPDRDARRVAPAGGRRWAAVGATLGHRLLTGLVLAGSPAVPGWWCGSGPWDDCWAGGWDGWWSAAVPPAPLGEDAPPGAGTRVPPPADDLGGDLPTW
ncbi:hypothetical protein [Geodermatophilus sp. URMC 64]